MNRKLDGNAKIFSLDQDDLWIEALVPAESGMGPSESISFQVENISHIRSLGPKHSVIAVKGGPDITVALPKDELMERLNTGAAGETLDLKKHTVLENRGVLLERLRGEFRDAQEAAKYDDINALTFTAFVRLPQQKEYIELTFKGTDILPAKTSEGGSIMGGQALTFVLRAPKAGFPDGQFIMETTQDEFKALCRKARELGQDTLDIREYSRRKGNLTTEERAARGLPHLKDFHRDRGGP